MYTKRREEAKNFNKRPNVRGFGTYTHLYDGGNAACTCYSHAFVATVSSNCPQNHCYGPTTGTNRQKTKQNQNGYLNRLQKGSFSCALLCNLKKRKKSKEAGEERC